MAIKVTRKVLIDCAFHAPFPITSNMERMIAEFDKAGRYGDASDNEIEAFDILFDEMEGASHADAVYFE